MQQAALVRGLRNNNPLNIRYDPVNKWRGLVPNDARKDCEFCEFTSLVLGVRAAFKLLLHYVRDLHLCTPEAILFRWAPPSENITAAYLSFVCRHSGVPKDRVLEADDTERLIRIVQAMALYESGVALDYDLCLKAYQMCYE